MPPTPTRIRDAVAAYVEGIHATYVEEAASLPPGIRARLPLVAAGRFRVAAVGSSALHLVATEEPIAPVERPGSSLEGSSGPLHWTLSFFDATVLPALAEAPVDPHRVRHLLGITTVLYHLVLPGGSSLSPHRASHTGVALLAAHHDQVNDLDEVRRHFPDRQPLVDELLGAARAGLPRAQALLAHALVPADERLARLAAEDDPDPTAVRRALVVAARERGRTR